LGYGVYVLARLGVEVADQQSDGQDNGESLTPCPGSVRVEPVGASRQPLDAALHRGFTAAVCQQPVNCVEARVAQAWPGVDRYQASRFASAQDVARVQVSVEHPDRAFLG
jgi:hypothetical protein